MKCGAPKNGAPRLRLAHPTFFVMPAKAGIQEINTNQFIMNSEHRLSIIHQRLTEKLSPTVLEIIDESHKHKNHPGAKTGLGHFAITIASPKFSGKNSLQCHKMVYHALGELMQTEIHALKIHINKTV